MTLTLVVAACDNWDLALQNFPEVITGDEVTLGPDPTVIRVSGELTGLLPDVSVEEHGHVWSPIEAEPRLDNSPGQSRLRRRGNGAFTSEISEVIPGRRMFYRAYAVFEQNVIYGAVQSFVSTTRLFQELRVDTVLSVQRNHTRSDLQVRSHINGLPQRLNIQEYGITWADHPEPIVETDNITLDGASILNMEASITFTSTLRNLAPGLHYLRPYLKAAGATYYGEVQCIGLGNFTANFEGFPGRNCNGAIGFAVNGRIYYGSGWRSIGGTSALEGCPPMWALDPTTNEWEERAPIPSPQANSRVFVISDTVYLAFGSFFSPSDGEDLFSTRMFRYLPANDQWTQVADLYPAREGILALAAGGRIFAGGGVDHVQFSGPPDFLQDWWRYNPATDHWEQLQDLPFGHRAGGQSFGIGGRGYLLFNNEFWEYRPESDQWTALTLPPPHVGRPIFRFADGGKGYFDRSNVLWEFDPQTGNWALINDQYPFGWPIVHLDPALYSVSTFSSRAYFLPQDCD